MAQQREAPAYQEYAAAMMANINYRIMTLAERGLMDSMRRECWVNHAVPSDPSLLAKILSFGEEEVRRALPAVMPFFKEIGDRLVCPELEDYRAHIKSIRERQSGGGKQGAALTNSKRKPSKRKEISGVSGESSGNTTTHPRVDSRVDVESSVQSSPFQSSSVKTNNPLSLGTSDWAKDYETASNGH